MFQESEFILHYVKLERCVLSYYKLVALSLCIVLFNKNDQFQVIVPFQKLPEM